MVELAPMVGPYGTLRALVPAPRSPRGLAIGSLDPPSALAGLRRLGLAPDASTAPATDRLLLEAGGAGGDGASLLSLRCRASHPIEQQLLSLHGRWGASHQLDLLEMASRVLDDDGRLLPWAPPAEQPKRYEPFGLRVLSDWRPEVASLDRWCRVRVQSDPGLRQLLLSHGLLLIGPWALLASASRRRVEQAWHAYGQGGFTAAVATALHASYLPLYRQAKEAHKQQWGRSRGWAPDQAFLERLRPAVPPGDTLKRLQAIAAALRRYGLEGPPAETPLLTAAPDEGGSDDDLAGLAACLDPALQRACQRHRSSLLQAAGHDAALLRCLWSAYSEGLSQRACAERCGCSQAMVSRRLQLQRHATAIATAAALELGRRPSFASRLRSSEDCERLVAALASHLLAPHPDDQRPRLARWWLLDSPPNSGP
ncbi:MAG: hypothetical protein VKM17_01710 [Cyanobacteriota bacterium]|nr:hypothetical protein [Cyanobacteriota bacterium]